ncbi:MAG: hypothetical protein DSZ00_09815, partial [Gammaproteobacteria bacterium]
AFGTSGIPCRLAATGDYPPSLRSPWRAASVCQQGSGILTSMSRGNCFILLDEEQGDLAAGREVPVQPFAALV